MTTKSVSTEKMVSCGPWVPADGGFRAWLVVFSSFLINGLLFGIINSYSVIYFELQKNLEESGISDASSKACKAFRIFK